MASSVVLAEAYMENVERLRDVEWPMLKDNIYLDHAGTTLYAKSLIDQFSSDMIHNLYGNPHSASASSQLSTRRIDEVRLRLLGMFNADPEDFDLIFTANATASIKLVMDAFRDHPDGFWYGYHKDSHTSLIGVREASKKQRCFVSDADVESWISELHKPEDSCGKWLKLLAYPAQSNMDGRRLPLAWSEKVRTGVSNTVSPVYTLLDAAAMVSTSPLDLSDSRTAPDFVALSLYKIFGFPNLGALIIRKASSRVLLNRRYFGGGTVEMVVCMDEQWHERKSISIHDQLEDGTLPIHSIVALRSALDVHERLFGSMENISRHTTYLTKRLFDKLSALRHGNGQPVCQIYKDPTSVYGDPKSQGPVVAFNLRDREGAWVCNSELEKLASVNNIHLRTGGLCNPGGIASSLQLAPWEMRKNFSAGQRCGLENDIIDEKPTGAARISIGAMSTVGDVDFFADFVSEFFIQKDEGRLSTPQACMMKCPSTPLHVESLTIYPIKSCAGWRVPVGVPWGVRREGLVWDREWCLVHKGTNQALSQKRYPHMTLIRPSIDLIQGVLRIDAVRNCAEPGKAKEIAVPLSTDPRYYTDTGSLTAPATTVCGDQIIVRTYRSVEISDFFTDMLGVACQLARFPPVEGQAASMRHSKIYMPRAENDRRAQMPGAFPDEVSLGPRIPAPMLLSNESPILIISRSSVNRLNEQIKEKGGKAVEAEVFRANVVVAEDPRSSPGQEDPYAEDHWRYLQVGEQVYAMLGWCRRCQMVCIDQKTAAKNQEPLLTLARTRRFEGKIFFGQHACHVSPVNQRRSGAQGAMIKVGDSVRPLDRFESE